VPELLHLDPAPSVQIIARDAFVTDMSLKVEQVHKEVRALARDLVTMQQSLASLREDTDRNYRFAKFQDTEHREKLSKIDSVLKRTAELKGRLDAIDGKKDGEFHFYNNFESISRRLTELGRVERDFRRVAFELKLSAGLFSASVLLWLVTLVTGLM
jgi:hypothetical protein